MIKCPNFQIRPICIFNIPLPGLNRQIVYFTITDGANRITSYNVCYTKLLRLFVHPDTLCFPPILGIYGLLAGISRLLVRCAVRFLLVLVGILFRVNSSRGYAPHLSFSLVLFSREILPHVVNTGRLWVVNIVRLSLVKSNPIIDTADNTYRNNFV